ncbi:hypothetical protein [Nevskia ramosa]|uniref:hypothetical protein n=1 Tax=Nevskia ramosa TaxID=64002 RepID=UPI003D0E4748
MNHLEAIDAGVAAKRPYNEVARKVFLTYPTRVFVGHEERQYEILNDVAQHFSVPITSVQVAGSAKLGYSIHKKTEFSVGQSDLDLSIIDAQLFARYLAIGLNISKGYTDGSSFPIRDKQSTQNEYLRYLTKGIFRPDLMPTGQQRADWNNFFGRLSSRHSELFKSISAAVYLSQPCFESKQRSAIKARVATGTL